MKDYKSSLLIFLSVLLLVSAGLLFSSIYYFYFKMPQQVVVPSLSKRNEVASGVDPTDSLAKLYAVTIHELNKNFDSTLNNTDLLKASLDNKLNEFNELRTEILTALKDRAPNGDLGAARQKITELQQKVESLHYTNLDIESENKRLLAMLTQLTTYDRKYSRQEAGERQPVNRSAATKSNSNGDIFLLNDLHFSAIRVEDEKEQETGQAGETERLLGSFKISNRNIQSSNAEIVIVVLQPDGKVIQNSTWDTGTFETSEGRKIYSGKLHVDYNKGELKQLMFSVTADKYQHGNYTLKVYHKGILIGEIVKNLS